MTEKQKGLVQGVLAYCMWGSLGAYWKLLDRVSPIELLAHRSLWAMLTFFLLVAFTGQLPTLIAAVRDLRTIGAMAISAVLLAINWGCFVWAAVSGHLFQSSLGYFINPLVSVALGTLILRERLSNAQWIAIGLAAIAVAIMTWQAGGVPWVAVLLAVTFGLYGYARKTAKVDALVGSAIETMCMVPLSIGYLAYAGHALGHVDTRTTVALFGTGIITAVPLLLFASSTRRLPLTTVGFLQYLSPTGQFLVALAYGEKMSVERLIPFLVIWAGLVVFSIDLWRRVPHTATGQAGR